MRAAPAGTGNDWRQTIVMPPRAEAPAPDPNPDPGGGCGTPVIFEGPRIELFPGSDCNTYVVSLHNLRPDAEVVWTVDETVSSPWNLLYGENPATSSGHAVLVVYCGGYVAVDVTVDGASVGRYTLGEPA